MLDLQSPLEALDLGYAPRRFTPENAEELASALREADQGGQKVAPWGGGTEQQLGAPPTRCDLVLETRRLSGVLAYAPEDLTVSVRAGTTLAELRAALAPHGQFLPFDVPQPERATIGGVLAANTPSVRRFRYGAARDLVIGMTTALPSGELCKAGGRVVKNVAGYDLCKLWVGSLGTLGVFTSANFRVQPVCRVSAVITGKFLSWEAAVRAGLSLAGQSQVWSALCARGGSSPALLVVAEGFGGSVRAAAAIAKEAIAREGGESAMEDDPAAAEIALHDLAQKGAGGSEQAGALLRGSVAPGRLIQAIAALVAGHSSAELIVDWQADVGVGSLFVRVSGSDGLLAQAIGHARAELASCGGSLVVAAGSPNLRRAIDPWGASEAAAALARALKARMDPSGTLNPGRFCYGL